MSTETDGDRTGEQLTTRVTGPLVDTSMTITGDVRARHLIIGAPVLLGLLVAVAAGLLGAIRVAAVGLAAAMIATYPLYKIEAKNPLYRSVVERVLRRRQTRGLQQSLPWGVDEAREHDSQLHGVEWIDYTPEGAAAAELADGRVAAMVEVEGRPTAMQTESEAASLLTQYETVLDEQIETFDVEIYTTTDDSDPETVVGRLLDRAVGATAAVETTVGGVVPDGVGEGRRGRMVRTFLEDVADWFLHDDEGQWVANRFRHFVIVTVQPGDDQVEADVQATAENPGGNRGLRARVPFMSDPTPEVDDEAAKRRQAKHDLLDDRVRAVVRGMDSIEGLDAERCDVLTTGRMLLRYWSGVPSDDPGDEVLEGFEREASRLDGHTTPTERWLAPDGLDVDDTVVEIGDQLARTFSVAPGGWPTNPDPHFLGDLYTMREVDLDIKWYLGAEDKESAIAAIENEGPRVGIEVDDRAEKGDWSAQTIQSDESALQAMYAALQKTASQPWQVSLYVTVRVGPDDAWRVIEDSDGAIDDLDVAKRKALDEHCQRVRSALTSSEAGLSIQSDRLAALPLFHASSPLGADEYHYSAGPSKRTRMLGGAVAAAFPFATGHLVEEQGRRWGRDKQTGLPVRASLFERGAAPHAFTFGQSRSGKTYDLMTGDAEWYLENPEDRTLIVCDTEGGFEGLTELCGGKHIVIDGTEPINPLHIEKPPEHVIERERGKGYNHLDLKVEEGKEFFAAVIRESGGDPDDYRNILDGAIREAYKRQGIRRDPRTHDNPSPTIRDVIDVLLEQSDDPGSATWDRGEAETEVRRSKVGYLLDDLSAFKPGNRLDYMTEASDAGLLEADTNMIYIDLSQASADNSIMLHLILGQLYQKVKRRGKFKFSIDEAHHLLHSEEMVDYLEDAARAWARYDASLHFITQNPREFIERAQSIGEGQENKRKTILEQCSTIQAFRTPQIDDDRQLLKQLGMNDAQAKWVTDKAVQGRMGYGYSECLVMFQDQGGWFKLHVEASPFEDLLWNWNPRLHEADLSNYLDKWWDWQRHEVVGAGPPTNPENVEASDTPDPLNHVGGRNVGLERSQATREDLPPGATQAPVETPDRDVEQCLAITGDGSRCSRTARSDGFCYQHDASDQTIDQDQTTAPADD